MNKNQDQNIIDIKRYVDNLSTDAKDDLLNRLLTTIFHSEVTITSDDEKVLDNEIRDIAFIEMQIDEFNEHYYRMV